MLTGRAASRLRQSLITNPASPSPLCKYNTQLYNKIFSIFTYVWKIASDLLKHFGAFSSGPPAEDSHCNMYHFPPCSSDQRVANYKRTLGECRVCVCVCFCYTSWWINDQEEPDCFFPMSSSHLASGQLTYGQKETATMCHCSQTKPRILHAVWMWMFQLW